MKEITIDGKSFKIDCNALTYVQYRKEFNRGIFEDIKILNAFLQQQVLVTKKLKDENPNIDDQTIITMLSSLMLDNIDEFIEASTRLAYIMIYTADKTVANYEEWLKGITTIKTNDEWIAEVTEFAVSCFC